jgi:hypothetical protein
MAPTSAALIHLPPEQLHAGCLQLPHGGGEIVDHEADQLPSLRLGRRICVPTARLLAMLGLPAQVNR